MRDRPVHLVDRPHSKRWIGVHHNVADRSAGVVGQPRRFGQADECAGWRYRWPPGRGMARGRPGTPHQLVGFNAVMIAVDVDPRAFVERYGAGIEPDIDAALLKPRAQCRGKRLRAAVERPPPEATLHVVAYGP